MPSISRPLVLITGSAGLIGAATARALAADYEVIGLDHSVPAKIEDLAEFVPLDLTDSESVASAVDHIQRRWGKSVASIIHLAAYYDFSGEPSRLYQEVTIEGTRRLLQATQHLDLRQFVFSSTTLVHAPTAPGHPINEDASLDAKWDYPSSKVETEELLKHEAGLPLVILRIAGVYDDDCHSIPIAHQIQRIYERRLIARVFPGDISHGQPFVHLDDLVDAVVKTVHQREQLAPQVTLLVGEEQVMSYDELQRAISRQLHGEEWETQVIPKVVAKAGAWLQDQAPGEEPFIKPWMIELADDHLEIDVSRARSTLGWAPRHLLKTTLPRILERLQSDPARWYRVNELSAPAWLEKPEHQAKPAAE